MIWLPFAILAVIWLVAVALVIADLIATTNRDDAERPEVDALVRKGQES